MTNFERQNGETVLILRKDLSPNTHSVSTGDLHIAGISKGFPTTELLTAAQI